jgi:hypothetical protein
MYGTACKVQHVQNNLVNTASTVQYVQYSLRSTACAVQLVQHSMYGIVEQVEYSMHGTVRTMAEYSERDSVQKLCASSFFMEQSK